MDWRIAGPKSAVLYPYVIRILDWLRIGNRNLSFFVKHWHCIGGALAADWHQIDRRLALSKGSDWWSIGIELALALHGLAMDFSGLAFISFGLGIPNCLMAEVKNQKLRPDGGLLGFVGVNRQGIGSWYWRIGNFLKDWLEIGTNWVVCQSSSIHWYWSSIGNFYQSVSNFDKIGLDDRDWVQKKWSTLHKDIGTLFAKSWNFLSIL